MEGGGWGEFCLEDACGVGADHHKSLFVGFVNGGVIDENVKAVRGRGECSDAAKARTARQRAGQTALLAFA
jgi:hypothetical protein